MHNGFHSLRSLVILQSLKKANLSVLGAAGFFTIGYYPSNGIKGVGAGAL